MENANKEESEKSEKNANEKEKESLIGKIKIALSHVKNFFLWIVFVSIKFWNSKVFKYMRKKIQYIYKKIVSLSFITFLLAVGTFMMANYSRKSVNNNRVLVDIARQENERTEKLFVEHIKPVVVATPIKIYRTGLAKDGNKMCATELSIVNHSAFIACNVRTDLSYGGVVYIGSWLYADEDRQEKEKGVVNGQYSQSMSNKTLIQRLGEKERKILIFVGALDLDKEVVSKGNEGFPVHAKVTWENDRGRVFYETYKYKLTCTTVEEGEHYTFTPEKHDKQ